MSEVSFVLFLPPDVICRLIEGLSLEGLMMFLMVNPLRLSLERQMVLLEYKLNRYLKEDIFENTIRGCDHNVLEDVIENTTGSHIHANLEKTCECFEIRYNLINKKPPRKELKRVVKQYHDFYMELFGGILKMTSDKYQDQVIKMFFKPDLPIDHPTEELYTQMSNTNIIFLVHRLVLDIESLYYVTSNILSYLRILLEREFDKNIFERDSRDKIMVMHESQYFTYLNGDPSYIFEKSNITNRAPEKYFYIRYDLAKYLYNCNKMNALNEIISMFSYKYQILLCTQPESIYGKILIQ